MFDLRLENINANVVNINDGVNYLVLGCSGLTPPPATIFTGKSPNRKGVKYNGSSLDSRSIVMQIKLLGDIEKNRNALYEWIDTEQYCKVHYRNGAKNVYCEGHIQDCDGDFFTDNEIISVAILCKNPYWKDLQAISTEISALLKQFTFPFAIDSVGIPFSTMRENNTTTIVNSGAETGVKITLICRGDVSNFTLFDAQDTTKRFVINTTLSDSWVVTIDTEGSPKKCFATKPDGTTVNLLKYVGNNPTWFTLKKGHNIFGFTADSGLTDVEVFFGYENKYLGV